MHLNKYSAEPFEFMSCLCKEKEESSDSQGFWRDEGGRAARRAALRAGSKHAQGSQWGCQHHQGCVAGDSGHGDGAAQETSLPGLTAPRGGRRRHPEPCQMCRWYRSMFSSSISVKSNMIHSPNIAPRAIIRQKSCCSFAV